MKPWLFLGLVVTLTMALLVGCVTGWITGGGIDSRVLNVQTLSLFNQRINSKLKDQSWLGDWIFRRERLALIDDDLRDSKPDLLILQEVLSRNGSPSESDENILAAGALQGYEFESLKIQEYEDTREFEELAVAASLPLKITPFRNPNLRRLWNLGIDGFMSVHMVSNEDQDISVFNVKMPSKVEDRGVWYQFMQEQIYQHLKAGGFCPERLIIAGFMPVDVDQIRFKEFLTRLQVKDVAEEACRITSACNTLSPTNEILLATMGSEEPSRTDRILVNSEAYVFSTARSFIQSTPASSYTKSFGLTRLWAARRFGWGASVRIPRCRGKGL